MPEIDDDDASSGKDRRARGEFQYDQHGSVERAHVPMMLRDAAVRDADRREVQRQIKADADRRELQHRIVDAAGYDGLALLKPGSRRLADASAYSEVEAAYEQATRDSANAWRRGPGHQDALAHGTEYSGQEDAVCVPDKPALQRADSMSVADAQAIKDRAYDEMCRRSGDAWRHLGESA